MKTLSFARGLSLFLVIAPLGTVSCSDEGLFDGGSGASPAVGGSVGAQPGVGGQLVGAGGGLPTGGGSTTGGTGTGGGSSGGASSGGASSGGSLSGGASGVGGAVVEPCTDNPPAESDSPGTSCATWKEWDNCDQAWFVEQDACNETCGRCTSSSSGGASGAGGSSSGGGSNGTGGGNLGDDNPWGNVTNGQNGWASRYWDCCKQSCAWANNAGGNPVVTCDTSGNNEVNRDTQSVCSNGSSTTCNSFAPWAYSNKVSFGFVAMHAGANSPCNKCYKLQFTGSGHNGNDVGSQALKDKVMIVMATNIGGDVSNDGQMDMLIPGGGTGAFFGCGQAWGVQQGDPKLGAQYGGLRSGCQGDLNSVKSCVRQKCDALFGNLPDMKEGCYWYVDWFEAADNPNFVSQEMECPQQLNDVAR